MPLWNNQKNVCISILDIDPFKQINDTKDHSYGDYVLVEVAKILRNNLRKKDSIGRYGGEEFMVVLPEIKAKEALDIINRIRRTIEKHVLKVV